MRRHERQTPSDVDDDRDLTQQFWGPSRGWDDQPNRPVDPIRPDRPRTRVGDDTTGAIRAIRDGFAAFRPHTSADATGEIDRTRRHGIVRPQIVDDGIEFDDRPRPGRRPDGGRERTLGELASDAAPHHAVEDEFWHDAGSWDDEPTGRQARPTTTTRRQVAVDVTQRGARPALADVDPLLLRVGVFVLALIVLFPIAWVMRSDDSGTITTGTAVDTPGVATTSPPVATTASPVAGDAPVVAGDAPAAEAAPVAPAASADQSSSSEHAGSGSQTAASESAATTGGGAGDASGDQSAAADVATSTSLPATDADLEARASGIVDEPATVDALADRIEPDCSLSYTAQPGDSWYSVAAAAGVSPTDLISENRATLDTIIVPGDEICLPDDATVPTTTEPSSTTAPESSPTTTSTPETTPTTEAPQDTSPVSESEAKQVIRDVFPDELEEKALDIAFKESRYDARAYNGWCCYGLFQIYWSVHQDWLDDYDIHSIEDLYDPRKNAEAAYALYRAAGGWSPWSTA